MRPLLRLWVVGLSVLAGSGWLLTQSYPSELGFPFSGCIHFALIGLSGLLAISRVGWERWSLRSSAGIAIAGGCIFVLPGTVLELTAGGISSFTSVALFCAIPVVTVFGAGAFAEAGDRGQLLWPALVGLLGALLLFPVEMPGSFGRILCFAAVAGCCVIVGLAGVWMHDLLRGLRVAQAVAVVGAFGAIALGFYGVTLGWPKVGMPVIAGEAARCAAFDLPLVWLTVWLMRDVDPARLSARFLIAPLATAAEGYAIERGPLDVRKIAALALMAAGAAMLLLKDEAEEVPGAETSVVFSTAVGGTLRAMAASMYIVVEGDDPGYDIFVNGSSLAQHEDAVERLALRLGVRPLIEFFSADENSMALLIEEGAGNPDLLQKLPPPQWYSPADGVATVTALVEALRQEPQQLGSEGPLVLAELEEYQRVLRKTEERGLRWHLAVSWR